MAGVLFIAVQCYLLGSIPFGYLLVRVFCGEDVRLSGSGNIGATNVARKSPVLGAATLLLDALKGTAAVKLTWVLSNPARGGGVPYAALSMAALFAVLGHLFPVWLKFHGGKGVATGLGSFLVIAPKAALVSVAIFIAVLLLFRYVSLASIIAVACFPVAVYALHQCGGSSLALAFILATSLLIIARHHENIRRLLAGTENRLGAKRA
jgi:acyl phosphate:glycerol-3-phosphate acyltransferase